MEENKKARGRAKLVEHLLKASTSKDVPPQESSEPETCAATCAGTGSIVEGAPSSKGRGRADLKKFCTSQPEKAEDASDSGEASRESNPEPHGSNISNVSEKLDKVHLDKDAKSEDRKGEFGEKINLSTNYIKLFIDPSKAVYEYEVTFSPTLEYTNHRYKLLYDNLPGKKDALCFDGASKLFTPEKITADTARFVSNHPVDESPVTMLIKLKNRARARDCAVLYNTLFRNCSRVLRYTRFGSKYFDYAEAIKIPQHKLEIWPGFVTSVDEFDGGIQLRCDTNHRVLRTDTALDILTCLVKRDPANYRRLAAKDLLGQCVLTKYNNSLYRIDDIDWAKSPTSTFTLKNGEEISFLQYYKKQYNIDIVDLKQPLLISRAKDDTGKKKRLICLVPEICFMTGLTDKMKTDVKVMKDVASYTRVTPSQRAYAFKQFLNNIKSNEEAKNMLQQWGLSISEDTIKVEGRNLRSEAILLRSGKLFDASTSDWMKSIRDNGIYKAVDILSWIVFFPKRDFRIADTFVSMVKKVGPGLGIEIADPKKIALRDDRIETYIDSLRHNIDDKTQIVVCICPTAREDRYCAIKKFCCKEVPIPSQVVNTITLSREDRMRAVVQNIALQMNHKLGGAGWAIKIPFQNTMICGVDSYHEKFHTVGSVGGFVASSNSDYTEWFSRTNFQGPKQEFINGVVDAFISSLKYYVKKNNVLPDRIVVYRDGVSDGQLKACLNYEVPQFLEACKTIKPEYQPKFSFIVVQKRNATKFYECTESGEELKNPRPGDIIDHVITKKDFFDFYLVSQFVRIGTATPTHYIVLYDNSKMKPDHIQRLTYKFCHLYYNWPGAIRVPAPCQYAHKLAYLVGQNIKCMPDESLENKLYYL